jgi:hypothetical protein
MPVDYIGRIGTNQWKVKKTCSKYPPSVQACERHGAAARQDAMLPPEQLSTVVEFPNETCREMPESLRSRLEATPRNIEEQAATSERASARAHMLRDAHLTAVKERAARDSQRAVEAGERKRRRDSINLAVLEAHMLSYTPAQAADGPVSQEPVIASRTKRDAEKARREALAAGVPNHSKARMETELSPPAGTPRSEERWLS